MSYKPAACRVVASTAMECIKKLFSKNSTITMCKFSMMKPEPWIRVGVFYEHSRKRIGTTG